MKLIDQRQCLHVLNIHLHEIEKSPVNQEITDKIELFFDENIEYLEFCKEAVLQLSAIASRVKTAFPDHALLNKIQRCVKPVLPAELTTDDLTLTIPALFTLLRTEVHDDSIPFAATYEAIGAITEHLVHRNGRLNAYQSRILGELAQLMAKKNGRATAESIRNFKIDDESIRLKVAKLCIHENPEQVPPFISNFEIADPSARVQIAMLCAKWDGWATAENIRCFEIVDEKDRVEIAKLCAIKHGRETARLFRNFEIRDEKARIEIAKLCAEKASMETAKYFRSFAIRDPAARVEIIKLCALFDGYKVVPFIGNFEIADEKDRIEVARVFIDNDGWTLPEHFRSFAVEDPVARVSLAMRSAEQNGYYTAFSIKNFAIADESVRIEIAKLCAKESGWAVAANIKNFEIADEAVRIEIAKLCAVQSGEGTTKFIHNFEIRYPAVLLEIAKLCARHDGEGTPKHLKNFAIVEESVRIEIAKLCAMQNAGGVARRIKKFSISDEADRIEIAKLCAMQDGKGTARFIQKFKIADESARIEIAKLCALQNGGGTACYMDQFEILDESVRIEIAKLCAMQDGKGTAEYFQNFEILDEAAHVDICKRCAKQNGRGTAWYFHRFNIPDEADRIEIAKLCAQQDSERTAELFKVFRIADEAVRLEICKLCAQLNGGGTAKYIKNFDIADAEVCFKIYIECIKHDVNAMKYPAGCDPHSKVMQVVGSSIEVLQKDEQDLPERVQLFTALNGLIQELICTEKNQQAIQALSQSFSELNPFQQRTQVAWLARLVIGMTSLSPEAIDWLMENRIVHDLSAMRDPSLKQQLTAGMFALAESKKGRNRWSKILPSMHSEKGMRLLAIPFFALEQAQVGSKGILQALENVVKPLFRKDVLKIQKLLHTSHLLASALFLTQEQKMAAFHKIFLEINDEKQILENLSAAKGLLYFKESGWVGSRSSFKQLFHECFEKLIPLEGLQKDASISYEQIFASSRSPEGLLIYAAGLKTLNEPELLTSLGCYVVSVFNGTFLQMRYDSKDNPHLQTIYAARPDIKEKWERCREVRLQEVLSNDHAEKKGFDTLEWLHIKLFVDRHLGDEDVSYVRNYLDASDEGRKEIKMRVSADLAQRSKGKKKAALDTDRCVLNLKLQWACIQLAATGRDSPLEDLEDPCKTINQCLQAQHSKAEFVNDVKDLLEAVNQLKTQSSSEKITRAVITDHPIDLLLAGTDISGSCQRLDGKPDLNKALLGYLVDGKHQLLVNKNPVGKITSRAILRLLWDGTNPVLFRERFYPALISQKEKDALNQLAIQVAKELNVSITSLDGTGSHYGKNLHALGGPAPYEYCDACGDIQIRGVYQVHNAKHLTH